MAETGDRRLAAGTGAVIPQLRQIFFEALESYVRQEYRPVEPEIFVFQDIRRQVEPRPYIEIHDKNRVAAFKKACIRAGVPPKLSGEAAIKDPTSARAKSATIKSGPGVIKAAAANSALRRSFTKDREEAINRFRMISLSSALSESDEVGIEVLRNSPVASVVFRDTHICPVGEECPLDVIRAAGSTMRCGVCKLACKSIEHLPAITAKIRSLQGQISFNSRLFLSIKRSGDRKNELNSLAARIECDANELAGWRESEIVLREMLKEDIGGIHTEQPEIIREHLRRVVRVSSQSQFLAERLMDAEAYPALITDDLRIKASRLLAGLRMNPVTEFDPDAEIKVLSGALRSRMRALNIDPSDAGILLDKVDLLMIEQSARIPVGV